MNIISGVPLTSEAYRRSRDAALIKREVAEYKEHPCGRATLTAQAHFPLSRLVRYMSTDRIWNVANL